jgi:tripartite-type tricarboxylate transporter receptor subunit TctC
MTFPRRHLLALASAAALGLPARAQAPFPAQPIKIIVPYPAGGTTDILARLVGQKLSEAWGQPVVVENRAGAGGTIGNALVAKAPPDGYTVLMGITALVQQNSLMSNLSYDVFKDLAPVTQIARSPSMFAVPNASPYTTLKDFVAFAKANPGKLNYGTYGQGTSSHLQGSLLNQQAGLDLVPVPFQGSAPLMQQLVGGQLSSAFVDMASARAQLKNIRPLAVTGTQRLPSLPEVPSFKELGYQSFDPYGWFGMFLPGGVSAPLLDKYQVEVNRILRLPEVAARVEALGLMPGGGTPAEFGRILREDSDIYARIIKDGNIKLSQ